MAQFKTLGQLAELAQDGDDESIFRDAYGDAPVLVIKSGTVSMLPDLQATDAVADKATSVGRIKNPLFQMAKASSWVIPVKKSGKNPFAGLIIVGRASNNDILLSSSNISKVHAYLRGGDSGWVIQDRGSTNGTLVNHKRLESGKDHPLENGDEVQFGDVASMFLDWDTLSVLCKLVHSSSS